MVAVEHENNFGGSALSEIVKLKNFDASLGVLITYVSLKQRKRVIDEYNAAMSSGMRLDSGRKCEDILVVFGPYGMKPPSKLEWAYYAFDGREFQPL